MVVKHLITKYLHNLQVTCKVCRSCRSFAGIMGRIPRNICILHGFAYWFIVYTVICIHMHTISSIRLCVSINLWITFALVKPPLRGVTLAKVTGIIHPKMNPHPQATQDVDSFFLFIYLLEKLGITILAHHQWIHCSEWVLSGWEFKELNKTITIGPFSVSKHCDVFLWAELSWRQKDSPDRFTNASYEVC